MIAFGLLVPSGVEALIFSCVGLVYEKTIFGKCLCLSLDYCILSLASLMIVGLVEISSEDDVLFS